MQSALIAASANDNSALTPSPRKAHKHWCSRALALGIMLAISAVSPLAQGQELTVLYSFGLGADGEEPGGGLVRDAAGNVYVTAYYGGNNAYLDSGGIISEERPDRASQNRNSTGNPMNYGRKNNSPATRVLHHFDQNFSSFDRMATSLENAMGPAGCGDRPPVSRASSRAMSVCREIVIPLPRRYRAVVQHPLLRLDLQIILCVRRSQAFLHDGVLGQGIQRFGE